MPKKKDIIADRGAIIIPKKMNIVSITLPHVQSIFIFSNCNVLYNYIFKSRIQSVVHLLHLIVRLYQVFDKYVALKMTSKSLCWTAFSTEVDLEKILLDVDFELLKFEL